MTTSKKKKSSTSLHISRPYALHGRIIRFHRNDNQSHLSKAQHTVSATSVSETLRVLPSKYPESNNLFSEYIEDQTDIQYNDPAVADTEGEEKPKQRRCTKAMEEWLTYQDTYLQEMLRHNG